VAWGIQTLRSLPPFAFRSAIAVSGAAFGHNVHKVTPQIRLHCGSVCRRIGISDFLLHFRGLLVFRF
jgi:hypothetical protein